MSICCVITTCDLPAICVPCGFTDNGLPLGLQIVGRPRGDMEVLQLARAFERLRPYARQAPAISQGASQPATGVYPADRSPNSISSTRLSAPSSRLRHRLSRLKVIKPAGVEQG